MCIKRLAIALLFILCHCNPVNAQHDPDTTTGGLGKQMPFDREFLYKYHTGSKVSRAELFEVGRDGCLKNIKKKRCLPNPERVYAVPLKVRGNDTSGNVYIEMIQLRPATEYFLIMFSDVNTSLFTSILDSLSSSRDSAKESARSLYNKLQSITKSSFNTKKSYECTKCPPATHIIGPFDTFYKYFVLGDMAKIGSRPIEPNKPQLQRCTVVFQTDFIRKLLAFYGECLRCEDTVYQVRIVDKKASLLKVSSIYRLNEDRIIQGDCSIDSISCNVAETYDQKLKNLQATKEYIAQYLALLNYFYLKSVPPPDYTVQYNNFKIQLESYLNCLENNIKATSRYIADRNKLASWLKARDSLLKNYPGLQEPYASSLTNTFTDGFETRNGLLVRADFGLMAYGNPWSAPGFWGVSPYLGFHLNFRRYDTERDWKNIDHKRWPQDYLSFNAGLLLATLAEEGKREGIIGNKSIFSGIGYALGHGVRITTGGVFFKKFHSNPLINRRQFAVTPYMGVSIDLRIQDVYKSFTGLF